MTSHWRKHNQKGFSLTFFSLCRTTMTNIQVVFEEKYGDVSDVWSSKILGLLISELKIFKTSRLCVPAHSIRNRPDVEKSQIGPPTLFQAFLEFQTEFAHNQDWAYMGRTLSEDKSVKRCKNHRNHYRINIGANRPILSNDCPEIGFLLLHIWANYIYDSAKRAVQELENASPEGDCDLSIENMIDLKVFPVGKAGQLIQMECLLQDNFHLNLYRVCVGNKINEFSLKQNCLDTITSLILEKDPSLGKAYFDPNVVNKFCKNRQEGLFRDFNAEYKLRKINIPKSIKLSIVANICAARHQCSYLSSQDNLYKALPEWTVGIPLNERLGKAIDICNCNHCRIMNQF